MGLLNYGDLISGPEQQPMETFCWSHVAPSKVTEIGTSELPGVGGQRAGLPAATRAFPSPSQKSMSSSYTPSTTKTNLFCRLPINSI